MTQLSACGNWWTRALTTVLSIAFLGMAYSGEPQGVNRTRDGVGIKGYDPVAYFTAGRAVPGNADFEHTVDGIRYRFANADNRDAFAKDPNRYLPQYGGFCAYAVSRGYTADIDPEAWAVVDGKLYLNYSKRVRTLWQEDVKGNIQKADANWPALRYRSR